MTNPIPFTYFHFLFLFLFHYASFNLILVVSKATVLITTCSEPFEFKTLLRILHILLSGLRISHGKRRAKDTLSEFGQRLVVFLLCGHPYVRGGLQQHLI